MILNIFGPSGSGKTTFVRKLLEKNQTQLFFDKFTSNKCQDFYNSKISISLIPLPLFRGTVKEFFDIFLINLNILLDLEKELKDLSDSIFDEINDKKSLDIIAFRRIETFSAGEMRRLFILKSLLVDSNIIIIDEPFSNSDEKVWDIIYKAINVKSNAILLSHLALDNLFFSNTYNKSIHINQVNNILND
tara:strand:- start:460 stop:1029 length:570 start_codon:yes stop_codon:yes gene_type:complete